MQNAICFFTYSTSWITSDETSRKTKKKKTENPNLDVIKFAAVFSFNLFFCWTLFVFIIYSSDRTYCVQFTPSFRFLFFNYSFKSNRETEVYATPIQCLHTVREQHMNCVRYSVRIRCLCEFYRRNQQQQQKTLHKYTNKNMGTQHILETAAGAAASTAAVSNIFMHSKYVWHNLKTLYSIDICRGSGDTRTYVRDFLYLLVDHPECISPFETFAVFVCVCVCVLCPRFVVQADRVQCFEHCVQKLLARGRPMLCVLDGGAD